MIQEIPQLSFISLDKLVIHERHDDERTLPLIKRIRSSGVFRNPPIVAPLQDGTDRYMVLDGANRTTALKEMDYPDALVQVVQPDDPGLSLQNWNHVVWELSQKRFLSGIRQIPGIRCVLTQEGAAEPNLSDECGSAIFQLANGKVYAVCTEAKDLEKRVDILNAVVDSYRERARLDRTSIREIAPLIDIYPRICGLVLFPHFKIEDVLRLASKGYLLPSGITRFTISPRALHLNYPLEELAAHKPLEEKNEALEKWLQERLARKGVRYYAEPTFLFDE
jgi:hypothetical protein